MIHPTAIVDPKAEIAADVEIGPYAVIGSHVHIGSGTTVGAHAVIEPYVTIGDNCKIFQFAAIGAVPQDLKFGGEKSHVKIGKECVVREFVTIHRGTEQGGGVTEIGDGCLLMNYSHVAHDCKVGRRVVMANCATLAGHITIGDYATIGGLVGIHQFTQVGEYAFISGLTAVTMDIPPYVTAAGERASLRGLNLVGLKRHGFSETSLKALKKAYRIFFRTGLTQSEAVRRVQEEVEMVPEVVRMLDFIKSSKRGVTR
jgi:UDP-N-acetylglucosamine acyltransferase